MDSDLVFALAGAGLGAFLGLAATMLYDRLRQPTLIVTVDVRGKGLEPELAEFEEVWFARVTNRPSRFFSGHAEACALTFSSPTDGLTVRVPWVERQLEASLNPGDFVEVPLLANIGRAHPKLYYASADGLVNAVSSNRYLPRHGSFLVRVSCRNGRPAELSLSAEPGADVRLGDSGNA